MIVLKIFLFVKLKSFRYIKFRFIKRIWKSKMTFQINYFISLLIFLFYIIIFQSLESF